MKGLHNFKKNRHLKARPLPISIQPDQVYLQVTQELSIEDRRLDLT